MKRRVFAPSPICRIFCIAAYQPDENAPLFESALPWLPAFRETIRRRAIPANYFEDLLKGVEMDRGRVRLQTWDELDRYCYHVAVGGRT